MKNISEYNVQELQKDELLVVNGGTEFSEALVKSVGWVVGAIGGIWESFITHHGDMYVRGHHPIPC